jgi:hypothetical protein
MIEAALVGAPSEEFAPTGVEATLTRVMGVATRAAGEGGLEIAGAWWPIETVGFVVELLGSKDSAS